MRSAVGAVAAAVLLAAAAGAWARVGAAFGASDAPLVVDIGAKSPTPSYQTQIAVQTCSGLRNRLGKGQANAGKPLNETAYLLTNGLDEEFLNQVVGVPTPPLTSVSDFLKVCLHGDGSRPWAGGALRYNLTSQHAILPVIITLAGVLDAVPLEEGDPAGAGVPVVFDAVRTLDGMSVVNATEWVYDYYGNMTTTVAMMDPGYDVGKNVLDPPLTGMPNFALVDFIVSQRLFNFFMYYACIPGTPDNALLERMVTDSWNSWPRPIAVWGYNNAWQVFGGDLFEAETGCAQAHNMGQIASDSVTNFAFFSSQGAITRPTPQLPDPPTTYDASKTYLSLFVGDGDNIGMVKSSRYQWMSDRVANCSLSVRKDQPCYPLVWTLSPHLTTHAKSIADWYWAQARATGAEYFVLPPSGALYAYPGEMEGSAQANFVTSTNQAAWLYNTSGTVDWEPFLTWDNALKTYFPRYTAIADDVPSVQGFFGVNVPFDLPVIPFLFSNETYKVLEPSSPGGQSVVVFKPREWRGVGNTSIPFAGPEYYTPEAMAAEVNGYEPGTVAYIYLTSDGGGNLSLFDELVSQLADHVEVVNQNVVTRMAIAAHEQKKTT